MIRVKRPDSAGPRIVDASLRSSPIRNGAPVRHHSRNSNVLACRVLEVQVQVQSPSMTIAEPDQPAAGAFSPGLFLLSRNEKITITAATQQSIR